MKTAHWYYVDPAAPVQTESDAFEHIIVTSMQSALEPGFYRDALLAEYEDLTEAMREGRGGVRVERMLARCMRALQKLQSI